MKLFITGSNGLLGTALITYLHNFTDYQLVTTGKGAARFLLQSDRITYYPKDLCNHAEINAILEAEKPSVIIHAGALTQVDYCEVNREEALAVNYAASLNIFQKASNLQSRLIFISTDFVFDGNKGMYTETDERSSVNWYGQTKIMAEDALMEKNMDWSIVRTCLVYGNNIAGQRTHILSWVKENLQKGNKIQVVDDQYRTPTYVEDLAKGIVSIIQHKSKGIYHISGEETMTPYQMAIATATTLKLDTSLIQKVTAAQFTQTALRPAKTGFSILKAKKELGFQPNSFSNALQKIFKDSI